MAEKKSVKKKKDISKGLVQATPRPLGRPCSFRPELGAAICEAISKSTKGLARICEETPEFPTSYTVHTWVSKYPDFALQYARAKEAQADFMFDQINDVACETNAETMVHKKDANGNPEYDADGNAVMIKVNLSLSPEVVSHKRLRIEALKWTAGKLRPRVYGEKNVQEHSGPNGGPIPVAAVNWKSLTDEELEIMNKIAQKSIGAG